MNPIKCLIKDHYTLLGFELNIVLASKNELRIVDNIGKLCLSCLVLVISGCILLCV